MRKSHLAHASLLALFLYAFALQAGPQNTKSWLKKGAKSALKFIPGGETIGELIGVKGDLETKVDQVDQKQTDALEKLRAISQKALAAKNKIEEMYQFKKRAQELGKDLSGGLKASKTSKFFGAMAEQGLGFPINPAEYIPQTSHTQKLKKNLELDLSLEKSVIQQTDYMLQDTRAALISSGLYQNSPRQFDKQYAQAQSYEHTLAKALAAKEQATLKGYSEEIKRLEKEVKVLEKEKGKQGLKVSEVVQIELLIEAKRGVARELNEKITQGLRAQLTLSPAHQEALAHYQAKRNLRALSTYLASDEQKLQSKYDKLKF